MDRIGRYSVFSLARDIWASTRPYGRVTMVALSARLVAEVVWLYMAIAIADIITELARGTQANVDMVWGVFVLMAAVIIVRTITNTVANRAGSYVRERIVTDAEQKGIAHLMHLDMSWHEHEVSGAVVQRVRQGAQGMGRVIHIFMNVFIAMAVNVVGIPIILLTVDQSLVWPLILFMIAYYAMSFFLGRKAAATAQAVIRHYESVTGTVYESVSNVRTVKMLSVMSAIGDRLHAVFERLIDLIRIRIKFIQRRQFLMDIVALTFQFGMLVFIAIGVVGGRFEVGILILFHRYFGSIWDSVRQLADASQEIMESRLAVERMQTILKEPVTIAGEEGKRDMPALWQKIRLENVSFAYHQKPVLEDITLTITRGEKVGIVGLSGAGKSTLFKLLLKERDTYTGALTIDDVPLSTIKNSSYFTHVCAVLQDTEVFNLSLKDNVTLGADLVDEVRLDEALRGAHVTDFLHKLPNGVDTVIGERGVKLSGGEKQRLGIARALYRKPELLLMDEATSHLDSESEEKIRDSLLHFFEHTTALVIAHRLSTIQAMDRIIVIEDGAIIEEGKPKTLLRKKGRFHELWEKQKL